MKQVPSWLLLSVMIRLGQAFWHQETVAVIDGRLWELAVTPLGRCNNNRMTWEWSCQVHDMDTRHLDA